MSEDLSPTLARWESMLERDSALGAGRRLGCSRDTIPRSGERRRPGELSRRVESLLKAEAEFRHSLPEIFQSRRRSPSPPTPLPKGEGSRASCWGKAREAGLVCCSRRLPADGGLGERGRWIRQPPIRLSTAPTRDRHANP